MTQVKYPTVTENDLVIEYREPDTYRFIDPTSIPFSVDLINFQNGPIPEFGINGVTIESLLAACKHHLETFQDGKFPCMENDVAINHIRQAINILNQRTEDRLNRNVEGKHEV